MHCLTMKSRVQTEPFLKPVLKRGALVAAANWQVTLIQATADSLFKLLIATPRHRGAVPGGAGGRLGARRTS